MVLSHYFMQSFLIDSQDVLFLLVFRKENGSAREITHQLGRAIYLTSELINRYNLFLGSFNTYAQKASCLLT